MFARYFSQNLQVLLQRTTERNELLWKNNLYLADDIEVIDAEDYSYEVVEHFSDMPEVAKPATKGC